MYNPYTAEKVFECRRDELLREAHQREHYKALRAARREEPRRHATLVEHVRQVLRRMVQRGQVRWSDG